MGAEGQRSHKGNAPRFPPGLDRALYMAICCVGGVGLLALALAPLLVFPAEDATILFQFSRNLAHTGAISYIPNGVHAEGATDFLWMVLIAGGYKLHLPPFWTVALLNVASLLALGTLLAKIAGARVSAAALLFVAGCFALMPQFTGAMSGFSVLPFVALLTLAALCFVRQRDLGLAVTCLVLCLFRPDGVVFAVPLLLAALLVSPQRWPRLGRFVAGFAVPGLLYFLWRWHYFHSFLPLPFLVKSNVQDRIAHVLVLWSVQQSFLLCVFCLGMGWLLLRKGEALRRNTWPLLLCFCLLPNLFYFSLRLEQNVGLRFFAYLLAGLAIVMAWEFQRTTQRRVLLLRAGVLLWAVFLCRPSYRWLVHLSRGFDNRTALARDLPRSPGATMIVTEAGIVPFESGWSPYDAWGLNTADFAASLFQPADMSRINPDLALISVVGRSECVAQADWATPYKTRDWKNMSRNMVAGMGGRYDLWYVPLGNTRARRQEGLQPWQGLQECWFVRKTSPLRAAVEQDLRSHEGLPQLAYDALVPSAPPPAAGQPKPVKQAGRARRMLSRLRVMWDDLAAT